ncbi:MAG: protein translocase subunit SecD [Deinococcales bacterium]
MNRRTFTAAVVAAAIIASILYLWQPWTSTPPLKLGLDLQGGLRVVLQANTANPSSQDLATARNVIENRVNQFGVSEPLITTSGKNRIVVELPGLTAKDQKRALSLIGQQAKLYFLLVKPEAQNKTVSQMTLDDLEKPAFTGEIISTARAGFQQLGGGATGGPAVFFNIKAKDASKFGDFTGGNVGRRMAIVLDNKIITAPTLQSRISDSGQITGIQSIDEASNIALVLRSGSLPISLHVEEIRSIGPTLGQDSINAGKIAGLIGAAAVIIAILSYYGFVFGGVLTLGLGLAMLFIFGALAGLHAALTLPGLAGLVLTIGAAVDGNVISFERIREELRAGKSIRLAMKTGFGNSLSAIIDANVTTLLAAAALYQYTSGPVRGFAITLAIGIIASVFVNVVVVPFILDLITAGNSKRTYLWKGFFVEGVRFVSKAPVIMTISGLLAIASIVVVASMGLKLSTDFTGGTNVLVDTPAGTTVADVRKAIDELNYPGISGQNAIVVKVIDNTVKGNPMSVRVGLTQTGQQSADQFANDLTAKLNGQLLQANYVGPAVGADLRQAAVMAVLVALGLILLYVAWRFWPNWIVAVAAIIATIHDAGIVLGALDLFNITFSIPVLAGVLFVVGYSLNDSIIIADRIREDLRKVRDRSYAEVVDLAVNQTLSRTVATSGTTLLPVIALFLFGGSVLRGFSVALLVGIGFGTYSSIFILSPLVVWFKTQQQKRARRTRRRTA